MSIESLLTPPLRRDPSGRQWLGLLLRAAPRGPERLGEDLVENPGSLSMSLSVRGISGRLAGFEYPLVAPRELTRWMIEHPDALSWPDGEEMSAETLRLRRALLNDEPPGSRSRAQKRARELLRSRSVLSHEWWRFEEPTTLPALLMTDRLVLTVLDDASDPLAPASSWYPPRPRLIRALDAARELAEGRAWGTLLLSHSPIELEARALDEETLAKAAPHLDSGQRRELGEAYLGNLTFEAAAAAIQG
jgi:hypothetical protein